MNPTLAFPYRDTVFRVCVVAWIGAAAGCNALSDDAGASNEPEPAVASASAESEAAAERATADEGVEHRIDGTPVSATLALSRSRAEAGDTIELSVKLEVAALWEIRTLDAHPNSAATRLELQLPGGLEALGEWQAPEPLRSLMPEGHAAYADEAVFTRRIAVTERATVGEQRVKCRVRYQACDQRRCLQPSAIELSVPLHIEHSSTLPTSSRPLARRRRRPPCAQTAA